MKLAFILFLSCLTLLIQVGANLPITTVKPLSHEEKHTIKLEDSHKDVKHAGHKRLKGKKSAHHTDVANKGEKLNEKHVKTDDEHGGKKTEHFAEGGHKSGKSLKGGASHGAKFQEGTHHKKGNFKKGFREQYHKDELKKHDSFFSNSHKSGEYNVYGKKNVKHQTHSVTKKKGNSHKAGKSEDRRGKSNVKLEGHNLNSKQAHQLTKAGKTHHEHKEKWAKKGGKKGGK